MLPSLTLPHGCAFNWSWSDAWRNVEWIETTRVKSGSLMLGVRVASCGSELCVACRLTESVWMESDEQEGKQRSFRRGVHNY